MAKRLAAHILHHDIRKAIQVTPGVDKLHDIRVTEFADHAGFLNKTRDEVGVAGEVGLNEFDGHGAVDAELCSLEHHAHTSRTQDALKAKPLIEHGSSEVFEGEFGVLRTHISARRCGHRLKSLPPSGGLLQFQFLSVSKRNTTLIMLAMIAKGARTCL